MTKKYFKIVGFILLAIVLVYCVVNAIVLFSSMGKNITIAEKAVGIFHQQLNNQQFRSIIAESSKEFKNSDTLENTTKFLKAIADKLGTAGISKKIGWKVNSNMLGTTVTYIMLTDYQNDRVTEQFVYRVAGNKAVLVSYNIDSRALIYK